MWPKLDSFQDLPRFTRWCGGTSRKRSWPLMPSKKRALVGLLQAALLIVLVGAWEIASRFHWIDPFFFSQPSIFGARALRWLTEPGLLLGGRSIYHHLLVTMEEMAGGFTLGVIFGVVVGFLLGRSQFWSAVLN